MRLEASQNLIAEWYNAFNFGKNLLKNYEILQILIWKL